MDSGRPSAGGATTGSPVFVLAVSGVARAGAVGRDIVPGLMVTDVAAVCAATPPLSSAVVGTSIVADRTTVTDTAIAADACCALADAAATSATATVMPKVRRAARRRTGAAVGVGTRASVRVSRVPVSPA